MSTNKQPLVSAIIPTHNRSKLLKRAINSVLEQTWENMEIVVVDDASEDDTPDLLRELSGENPITVVRNESSRGAAASRNIAIKHAKGDFVAGLDDDDFWRPRRVELLMGEFEDGYSAVCSNDRMVFDNREIVWKKKPVITLNDLLFYNQVGNQLLTKREYLVNVGGYDESLSSAQDYDLWIRLTHDYGPIKTVPHTLQVVNMEADRERISTSGDETSGYYACFEKHKHRMNEVQKKYQLYRMKLAKGDTAGWLEMFRSVPRELLVKEITRKLFL